MLPMYVKNHLFSIIFFKKLLFFTAMSVVVVQRVAHELYNLKVPVYPRELTELVNRLTSIDVHPGAKLGEV